MLTENLSLTHGRSRGDGGAIQARDSRLRLQGITVKDCRAKGSGGAIAAQDCQLELVDCQFTENRATQGGAISLTTGHPDTDAGLRVVNSLFANNQAEAGGAVYTTAPCHISSATFIANAVNGPGARGSAIVAADSLELLMCNIAGNSGGLAGSGPVVVEGEAVLDIRYTNVLGNTAGDWAGELAEHETGDGNLAVDSRFVNAAHGDFRLVWNSVLLDEGDPLAEVDFDLTAADIGWKPAVPTHQISSMVSENLEAHNYEVTGNCTITGTIRPGATIRTNTGVALEIQVPSTGPQYTLGDLDGPRTAIVGRPTAESESATSISFLARGASSPLEFAGVLFNYPAESNNVGELRFNSQYAPSNYSVSLDGDQVQFQNYSNVIAGGGSVVRFDANLAFWYSRGSVSNLDIRMVEGDPARLQVFNSAMTIEDCEFTPSTTAGVNYASPLQVFGMLGGETSHLLRNTFHGSTAQAGPLAHVTQSIQRVRRNQFLDCRTTALRQDFATMKMNQEGRNSFFANAGFLPETPMITMDDGDLDLFCGRNNFVVNDYAPNWPIITYIQRFYPGLTHRNWKLNFFGVNCSQSIPEQDLYDDDLLPDWVVLEDNLAACVPSNAPENPVCENSAITSYQLLKDGIIAETAGNYETARGNYFYLLALYPDSKETNEATLRLKALGLSEGFGSENFESIHTDLHSVADSSEAANLHSVAVLQLASGWCVEALYGDRPAAVAALQAAYAAETDLTCRKILNLAIAEIATYPAQGGMSATGPGAHYALALVQQEAVQALFALQQDAAVAETPGEETASLPQNFAIERLYPNPFNPTTVIELALPSEGMVKVEVFNLLGQSVATLIHEKLKAGRHPILFDGSALSSGMYLAVAEFEGHAQVRKMLLMK